MNTLPTPSKNVRLGVIGLGEHSNRSHISYLAEMPDLCTITALADIDEQRIARVNHDYGLGAKEFTDWQQMVDGESTDAELIMTPDRFHTVQLVGAVAAGKHVFCEKPLASTLSEYMALKEALRVAKEKDLVVSTCHPRRFDPPFITAREFLQNPAEMYDTFGTQGELGVVKSFDFSFDYHEPSKHGLHNSLMFDHLNHEVDLMHFLFGKSDVKDMIKHSDSETEFHVSGVREDSIAFSFMGSRKLKEQIYAEKMKITFEDGTLEVNMHTGEAMLGLGQQVYPLQDERFKTDYVKRFTDINRHFLRSVLGLEAPYISAQEMLINTKAAIDLS